MPSLTSAAQTAKPPGPGLLPETPAGPLAAAHVPYMALTEGEGKLRLDPRLVAGANGWIEHRDPTPYDRYPDFDVLLAQTTGLFPSGRPDGNQLSPYRQAHCMANLLCQGCARPAAQNPKGWPLWVLPATTSTGAAATATGLTDMPPSCARCATHWCPRLEELGRRLLWVAEADLEGVYGMWFPRDMGGMVPDQFVPFENERQLSAVVATRFVRDLRRVNEADPADVDALARQQAGTERSSVTCPPEPRSTGRNA
ncbi:hypothetical protein ACFVWY_32875 [Streptomyces sp. NPDC058195]|uniref:hypothetical protein n=1 Tax=Streptomyces sp. NPDC058195 TaxID=3346375 RepID=UPI0036E10026